MGPHRPNFGTSSQVNAQGPSVTIPKGFWTQNSLRMVHSCLQRLATQQPSSGMLPLGSACRPYLAIPSGLRMQSSNPECATCFLCQILQPDLPRSSLVCPGSQQD